MAVPEETTTSVRSRQTGRWIECRDHNNKYPKKCRHIFFHMASSVSSSSFFNFRGVVLISQALLYFHILFVEGLEPAAVQPTRLKKDDPVQSNSEISSGTAFRTVKREIMLEEELFYNDIFETDQLIPTTKSETITSESSTIPTSALNMSEEPTNLHASFIENIDTNSAWNNTDDDLYFYNDTEEFPEVTHNDSYFDETVMELTKNPSEAPSFRPTEINFLPVAILEAPEDPLVQLGLNPSNEPTDSIASYVPTDSTDSRIDQPTNPPQSSLFFYTRTTEPSLNSSVELTTTFFDDPPTGSFPLVPISTPSPTKIPTRSPSIRPSLRPTEKPTLAPTQSPSEEPTQMPSVTPTSQPSFTPTRMPTRTPTRSPTRAPSSTPSTAPSTAPSSTPTAKPTKMPTVKPSFRPSSTPTMTESQDPTPSGTLEPTLSNEPTISPSTSFQPTNSPTDQPSTMPTIAPSLPLQKSDVRGKMTLSPLLEQLRGRGVIIWETETENFIKRFLLSDKINPSMFVEYIRANIEQQFSGPRRFLQEGKNDTSVDSLQIQFNLFIQFRSVANDYDVDQLVWAAFDSPDDRYKYVSDLTERSDVFTLVQDVKLDLEGFEPPPTQAPTPEKKIDIAVIVGASVGSVAFIILIILLFLRRRSGKSVEVTEVAESQTTPTATKNIKVSTEILVEPQDDVSTLGDPMFGQGGMIIGGIDRDEMTATVGDDYDYTKHYRNARGPHSRDRAISEDMSKMSSVQSLSMSKLGKMGENIFADDSSFEEQFIDPEERLDVVAPAGKLGMVIDTPNGGIPVVHAIKDTSVLVDQVRVGDRLLSVDGEDCTGMTAMQVSKLISLKSEKPARVLVFARTSTNTNPGQ